MPRCYSCGTYTKKPHREFDGRAERAYCDLCHAEREWKFEDRRGGSPELPEPVPPPPSLSLWQRFRRLLKF